MRTETKLAPMRGALQKLHLADVLQSVRRVLDATTDRAIERRLRDIDSWSDQTEVAFYEEACAKRA